MPGNPEEPVAKPFWHHPLYLVVAIATDRGPPLWVNLNTKSLCGKAQFTTQSGVWGLQIPPKKW